MGPQRLKQFRGGLLCSAPVLSLLLLPAGPPRAPRCREQREPRAVRCRPRSGSRAPRSPRSLPQRGRDDQGARGALRARDLCNWPLLR